MCECRKEQCEYCEMVLAKKDIPQHLEDCPKYLKTVIDNISLKNEELTETVSELRIKLAESEACGYDKLIETKVCLFIVPEIPVVTLQYLRDRLIIKQNGDYNIMNFKLKLDKRLRSI